MLLNSYVYEDKTLEKALDKFYKETKKEENDILYCYNIEKVGILKSNKVIVKIFLKDEIKKALDSFIRQIGSGINININSIIDIKDDIKIEMTSDNSSALIGRNGKMLNSLQIILKKFIYVQTGLNIRVLIDVENYKKRKIEQMEKDVEKIIKEVISTKVDVKLDPMNSYERRIVHNLVSKYDNLTTESKGESPNRYVVIKYIGR